MFVGCNTRQLDLILFCTTTSNFEKVFTSHKLVFKFCLRPKFWPSKSIAQLLPTLGAHAQTEQLSTEAKVITMELITVWNATEDNHFFLFFFNKQSHRKNFITLFSGSVIRDFILKLSTSFPKIPTLQQKKWWTSYYLPPPNDLWDSSGPLGEKDYFSLIIYLQHIPSSTHRISLDKEPLSCSHTIIQFPFLESHMRFDLKPNSHL